MKQEAKLALQLLIIRDLARKALMAVGDASVAETLKEIMHRTEEAQHLLEHGVSPLAPGTSAVSGQP